MFRRVILAFVFALMTGCAFVPMTGVESNYVPSGAALVVYSARAEDSCGHVNSSVSLAFEYVTEDGSGGEKYILMKNYLVKSDLKDEKGRDYFLFIQEWPAGEYVFTKMRYVLSDSLHSYEVSARLQAGKVYYLGEFVGIVPNCGSVLLTVNDQYARDGALFDKQMTKLRSTDFTRGLLPFGIWKPKR